MPLELSSLANWDGRNSRGGEGREDEMDKAGRIRRMEMDNDMDVVCFLFLVHGLG